MREKLARFMYGRYGMDELSTFMIVVFFILAILSNFTTEILYLISIVLFVLTYIRVLSRNTYKRRAENEKFMHMTRGIRSTFNSQKNRFQQRKTHKIYRCPRCKQQIRVPKGKGRIAITCPSCRTEFIKRT